MGLLGLLWLVGPEVLSPLACCVTEVEVTVGIESPMKRLVNEGLPWTDACRVMRACVREMASGVGAVGGSR